MTEASGPELAIFDFDGTLIAGDSMVTFLRLYAGIPAVAAALTAALPFLLRATDWRTTLKDRLLRATLHDFDPVGAEIATAALAGRVRWLPAQVARLEWHRARGARVLVASGGLEIYLTALLARWPGVELTATRFDPQTGALVGGNCVREEKARRIQAFINAEGPFARIWAYGNLPHDLPMMRLASDPVIV